MAEYVKVAKLTDIPPGSMYQVELGSEPVVLANVDGQLFAFGSLCTHRDGPLAQGDLSDNVITCPWHGGQFEVRTGQVICPPPVASLRTFPVMVEGDDVLVAVAHSMPT